MVTYSVSVLCRLCTKLHSSFPPQGGTTSLVESSACHCTELVPCQPVFTAVSTCEDTIPFAQFTGLLWCLYWLTNVRIFYFDLFVPSSYHHIYCGCNCCFNFHQSAVCINHRGHSVLDTLDNLLYTACGVHAR